MKPSKLACLLCFQLVTNHVSFLKEPSSRDCLPIFAPICSGTISPIPSLLPLKQTKYIKAESPLLMFMPCLWLCLCLSTPEDQQSINAIRSTVPNHPRRTPHARIAGPSLLPCLITIVHYHGVPRPRNAELCVPCRETSSLPGGCSFTEFIEIPDRFWCFGINVSCSTFLFYLIRSQVAYSGWFLSHMLRFSDYPFTIWDPQV